MRLLFNLKFGIHKIHYGLSLLSCLVGGFVAARQIALHICPGFPQFGAPFWGLSLYTWSFLVFVSSVAFIALLLIFFDQKTVSKGVNWWDKLAILLVFLAAAINIFTTFQTCGFGPCSESI